MLWFYHVLKTILDLVFVGGDRFLVSQVFHPVLSNGQYAIHSVKSESEEGVDRKFLWSSSHPIQIFCRIWIMKICLFRYCITWLLAVIQLFPLFLVKLYGSTQWSFADVNSTHYLTALINMTLQIVWLNPMMCLIMGTSDASHYTGFMFHLLLQPPNVIAHKLSFVWISHTASRSQSASFCFHLYIRVLVAVRLTPEKQTRKMWTELN